MAIGTVICELVNAALCPALSWGNPPLFIANLYEAILIPIWQEKEINQRD